MAGKSKKFGVELTKALETIKTNTELSLTEIKDEIGILLGYQGSDTVEKWRQGKRLPNLKKLERLVRILVDPKAIDENTILESVGFNRERLEIFLTYGDYPPKSRLTLLKELFPPKSSSDLKQVSELDILPPEEPPVVELAGRDRELIWLQHQVETAHFAIVTGMPGVGKSAFSGTFARRLDLQPKRLFWYTVRGLDGLDTIVRRLAHFLAYHGELTFLQLLDQGRQPDSMFLDQILFTMQGKGYLLCFDDFHWIQDAEIVNQICIPLLRGAKQGYFDLLIVSRQMPTGIHGIDMNLLTIEGLTEEATTQLLSEKNQSLSDEMLSIVYQLTQGNPQLLIFAIEILTKQQDFGDLFKQMFETVNVERFLLDEIDRHLDDKEQDVMRSLSICMEYPAPYPLIEDIADLGNLRTALSNLCHRHLLLLHKGSGETLHSQHAIIQQFYYERIPRRERKAMHARAAAYYHSELQDRFMAAFHYEKAGEFKQAAENLIRENSQIVISQGYATRAGQLLESLCNKLSSEYKLQIDMLHTLGRFYRIQGKYELTIQILNDGFELADSTQTQIEFLDEIARMHRYQGTLDKAQLAIEQIINLYEQNPSLFREPNILGGIGWVYYRLGNIEQMSSYFIQAWGEKGTGLKPRVAANILLGLGTVAFHQDNFDMAVRHFTQSQEFSKTVGDLVGQAQSFNNLGLVYQEQGRFDDALENLETMLEIFISIGDVHSYIIGIYNIAIAYVQRQQYGPAESYIQDAYSLAEQIQNYPYLCLYSVILSQSALYQDNLTQAKTHFATAQQWGQKSGNDAEKGVVYYLSSAIALAEDDKEKAIQFVEKAIPLLEESSELDYLPLAQSVKQQALSGLSK